MYSVVYTATFEKSFKRLDVTVRQRVLQKIKWLAQHPELLADGISNPPPELAGLEEVSYRRLATAILDKPQRGINHSYYY